MREKPKKLSSSLSISITFVLAISLTSYSEPRHTYLPNLIGMRYCALGCTVCFEKNSVLGRLP